MGGTKRTVWGFTHGRTLAITKTKEKKEKGENNFCLTAIRSCHLIITKIKGKRRKWK